MQGGDDLDVAKTARFRHGILGQCRPQPRPPTTRLACPVMPVLAAIEAAMMGSSSPTCSARSPSRTPLIVTANGSLPTLDFLRNLRIFPMI
jgi:hypothetical protein